VSSRAKRGVLVILRIRMAELLHFFAMLRFAIGQGVVEFKAILRITNDTTVLRIGVRDSGEAGMYYSEDMMVRLFFL